MGDYEKLKLAELNYGSYLKVPELLGLQHEISDPPHHDEMFFIIIHQTAELWFKEMLHETDWLVRHFRDGSVSRALKALRRITGVMDLMVRQINLLSSLTPVEFAGFRDRLKPASGFQSVQFREIEFRYGLRDPFFLKFFAPQPEVVARFEAILKEPTVYDEMLGCLAGEGWAVPAGILGRDPSVTRPVDDRLVALIQQVYENPKESYHWVLLFETMLDFDEKFRLWRNTHVLMVARTIGSKQGTGGSAGYEFLRSRLEHQYFPELWAVRNRIGSGYGG